MSIITTSRPPALARVLRAAWITPELLWFVASPGKRADPYPAYGRLRALDPVHRSPLGVWVLSRHAEVSVALRNPALSSDVRHIDTATLHIGPLRRLLGRGSEPIEHGPYFELIPELLLFRDPPAHTRLRAQVSRAFTPRTVERLEARIHALAHELLDPIFPQGRAELMASFAYPFPARVICELIGVPEPDSHHIVDHSPALAAGLDPGPLLTRAARDAANVATEAITGFLDELIQKRRADPGDDLLSALLALDDGANLSHEDLIGTILLLLIAGHETTANLLGNGLVGLLGQPEQLRELGDDPSLDAAAVDELLRFDSPVQMTMRVATEPCELDGRTVEPGTVVILCTGAANHDPDVYEHPERLDWHRPTNPHLAFGGGIHYCLGATLARTEARIALRSILDRLPRLALAATPTRRPSFTVRGLDALHLTWTPEA